MHNRAHLTHPHRLLNALITIKLGKEEETDKFKGFKPEFLFWSRAELNLVPWGRLHNWSCIGCGKCCQLKVQITTVEWLNLTRTFGYNIISQETDGFFLNKALDGWCPFLFRSNHPSCGIQQTKPLACELWPFRIADYPRYGLKEEAYFKHRGRAFYIYAVPYCSGFRYGTPTEHFTKNVLPEFIDVRLGLKKSQFFSTGNYHSRRY